MNNIGPHLGDEPQCIITPSLLYFIAQTPKLSIRFPSFFLHQRNTYTCLLFPSLNIYADKNSSQCNAYHSCSNLKTFYMRRDKSTMQTRGGRGSRKLCERPYVKHLATTIARPSRDWRAWFRGSMFSSSQVLLNFCGTEKMWGVYGGKINVLPTSCQYIIH